MSILLSILIPTVEGREKSFDDISTKILVQSMIFCKGGSTFTTNLFPFEIVRVNDEIEIIWYKDNKEISVGEKRDRLYKLAKGKFSWQVDDDDDIADGAIAKIMQAIKNNPDVDCITFRELCNINGKISHSNFSIKYDDWLDNVDGYDQVRTPFFKTPIRTDYCQHIGVADSRFGEDHEFARLIKPMLLKEIHIDEEIYLYNHISTDHNERYGIR